MRIQFLIISALLGALSWVGAFHATRESYHYGISTGVIPNLHIKENLVEAFSGDPVAWHLGNDPPDATGNKIEQARYE